MLSQALADFGLSPDVNLDVMMPGQDLASLTSRLLDGAGKLLTKLRPDWVLVQGDTTTVMATALSAYYLGIKIGHVEAGLRSFNMRSPFPEEGNRRLTSVLADIHFAPTIVARDNLLSEGVAETSILVTGNTVIDALLATRDSVALDLAAVTPSVAAERQAGKKIVLVTCHRREIFGEPIGRIFQALRELADRNSDVAIIFPVHLNPNVRELAKRTLAGIDNVHLIEPLGYRQFVAALSTCDIVISDSGGIQEEAPALNKPVLVLRDVTERPEGIAAGVAKLVGSDPGLIVAEAERLLRDPSAYAKMALPENPYGDGLASQRIRRALFG